MFAGVMKIHRFTFSPDGRTVEWGAERQLLSLSGCVMVRAATATF